MIKNLDVEDFINGSKDCLILDVRSPLEYKQAHIPNAISFPIFTDEQRTVVGTQYKQVSREKAIKTGLDYFGPKMRSMIERVEELLLKKSDKKVYIHCWRGGMRSNAVAWLMDIYGFDVYLLNGGYKAYRKWVLETLSFPFKYKIIGGFTGSGKTVLLHELEEMGKMVLDLEKIAVHKGSTFGHIGLPPQPSQETFENELCQMLFINKEQEIWIEDESQRIGLVQIIKPMWQNMLNCELYFITVPFEKRLQNILNEYGLLDVIELENAINRIQKKLGGLEMKKAIDYLHQKDLHSCFEILLKYYDKYYENALSKRAPSLIKTISLEDFKNLYLW